MPAESPLTIFYIYAHDDEALKDKLDAHLSGLKREGLIRVWHDRDLRPGADWSAGIGEHLAAADIILALVSADFMNSDYCWGVELRRAMMRHARGEAVVVPVVIRPADWRHSALGELQALPRDGRAITLWPNRDRAWADVVAGLRALATRFPRSGGAPAHAEPLLPPAPTGTAGPGADFAHVSVMPDKLPRWVETWHGAGSCAFPDGCEQIFELTDVVEDADLWLDVTLLNSAPRPLVLTSVGAEFLAVRQIDRLGAAPQAAAISRSADEYVVDPPDLRRVAHGSDGEVVEVGVQARTRLPDPVYLPARAPYRFALRFPAFQQRIPNHARLRLLAGTAAGPAVSPVLHVVTW